MKICLAGYGLIGAAWARHYLADGFELAVWNRTPRPEAPGFVAALPEAVRGADVLHIVVADPPAVSAVLEAALPALNEQALVVQSSTISPAWARRFADQVESGGWAYVEAPFTGSKPAAEARQNVFYLGGRAEAKARAEQVLRGLSVRRFDIGTVEQAATLKLAMNLQIASIAQALTEALTLARSAGVSDELFFEVMELNVAKSGVSTLKRPKLLEADYSPQFSVKHMAKDLRLALETAAEGTAPLTRALAAIYEEGIRRGWGEEDFIGLVRLLQNAATRAD
jgi:3-hydroxyisobutyrate dehydrogenase-like beta-hydroxyacid dehydrogenase